MRLLTIRGYLVFLAVAAMQVAPASAQEPDGPVFPRLFPAPTGGNGYEEIVMAADLAAAAERRKALIEPEVTLTDLRAALRDPDRIRAIELLRRGLRKPITFPARPPRPDALQPELPPVRSLARLLAANIRAAFADGRNAEALSHLSSGLRLASALHGENLIGSLVAIAVHSIVLRTFASHLTQLSANDCDRLLELVRGLRRLPDPLRLALEAERRHIVALTLGLRKDPSALRSYVSGLLEGEKPTSRPDIQDQRALDAFLSQFLTDINLAFSHLTGEATKPPWQRKSSDTGGPPAGALVAVTTRPLAMAMTRFDEARTALQLLGVHAAIRRYAWEHQRLPASLDVLRLGEMTLDPFTGKPLVYRVTGEQTYDLYSVGTEGAPGGRRVDIVSPPRPAGQVPQNQ